MSNGSTSFQVEIFKNPTFTTDVVLKSPDIEDGKLTNLKKSANRDPAMPWYPSVYSSTFALEGIIHAHYYNGAIMKGIPFRYRIYRNESYGTDYWTDCFWGCYFEPTPEFYTE
jgi:hypothetical protein